MRAQRKSKRYAELEKNVPSLEPLDKTRLNAVMRNVFAWMTMGIGITATVASAFLASPIYPDLAGLLFIIIAHLAIAFTLDRKLRRFSPKPSRRVFHLLRGADGLHLVHFFLRLVSSDSH